MDFTHITLLDQAVTHIMVGVSLALANEAVHHFLRGVPQVVAVLRWHRRRRAIVIALAISLILQIATSLAFRSQFVSAYSEIALSPFEAIFNVLGVMLVDLMVIAFLGGRAMLGVSKRHLGDAAAHATASVHELGDTVLPTADAALHREERERAELAERQAAADARRQRLDDQLRGH